MKKISFSFFVLMALFAILISACGGAAPADTSAGAGKPQAAEFTGVIEAINGDQWTVNGQVITVDPAILRDGPFAVGDTVKVEVEVQTDGSVVVTRVEAPAAAAVNGNTNEDANSNSSMDNSNTGLSNTNDDNSNSGTPSGIVFDNSGSEAFGVVEVIASDTITIGGQTFTVTNLTEFKDVIASGDFVKVHFTTNPDGTLTVSEVQKWDPAQVGSDDNSNGNDNGSSLNGNDDNGNDNNGNDDHGGNGNDDNGNDDHGGNGNDDNGNDDHGGNGNDDNGNSSNSNG